MPANEFTFIQVSPDGSERARKILQSKAKSHAAYVAYRKQRSRKRSLRSPEPLVEPTGVENCISSAITISRGSIDDDSNGYQIVEDSREPVLEISYTSKCPRAVPCLQYEAFRGLRIDPFRYVPDNDEPGNGELIDFFARDIGTINEAISWVFNVTNMVSASLEIVTQNHFYHTLLCIVQSMKDQLQYPRLSPSLSVLRHKGRAIAGIRTGLARSPEADNDSQDTVLCAIVLLAVLEGRFQATAVRDIHKKTLAAIISQRGGLRNFEDGSLLKASALQFDMFWTWETGKTLFPGQRRVSDPAYPSNPFSNRSVQALPIGFRNLFAQGILSYNILPVLTRAAHFSISSPVKRTDILLESRRQKKSFNDFWEACPCLGLDDKKYHPLERLLTMTVIIFIYGIFAPRAFPTGPPGPAPNLTHQLMMYRSTTEAEEACVQWMWALAIDLSWRERHRDDRSSMAQLQLRYPKLRSVEAVVELGAKFLWTTERTKSVRSNWKDVTE